MNPLSSVSQESRGLPHMLTAALHYAREGFQVFPLYTPKSDGSCNCGRGNSCTSVGKHPRTMNGLKAATTDPVQIESWWNTWPDANIGIACGAASDIFVLDIDGPAGETSLLKLTERSGPLPATRTVKTGKGRQMYFRHPGGRVKTAAPVSKAFPGLDSRGDGGYVVAPPSLHANGNFYAVDELAPPEISAGPSWLVGFIDGDTSTPRTHECVGPANDTSIEEGGRNSSLVSIAGKMRYAGAEQNEIESALLAFNENRCNPPLDDDEVLGIARSVANYSPGSSDDVRRTLSDAGNAKRFAKRFSDDARYVPERGVWLVWRGTHWQADGVGEVAEMAKRVAADIYDEGMLVSDQNLRADIARHAKNSSHAARLRATLELASTETELVVPDRELDRHPGWLAVGNGTVHLGSGELRPSDRRDLITKIAPIEFEPEADCPIFRAFVETVLGHDPELVGYLQRVFGYAISGYTEEQVLFFLHGTGANGKSTLLNVLRQLLGPAHCFSLPAETIAARPQRAGATPELARLPGARVVLTNEIEDGSFLAESLVKQMTGGDAMIARNLYQAPFEFVPQFKLFIAGNHKPVIRGADLGIWRRINLIPFDVTIPPDDRDPHLLAKLTGELPGILNWALEGYRQWRKRKLNPPKGVIQAVQEYRAEMDLLGQWLEAHCEVGQGFEIGASDAYFAYQSWCVANGCKPWTNAAFGRALKERFQHKRAAQGTRYLGLQLKAASGARL